MTQISGWTDQWLNHLYSICVHFFHQQIHLNVSWPACPPDFTQILFFIGWTIKIFDKRDIQIAGNAIFLIKVKCVATYRYNLWCYEAVRAYTNHIPTKKVTRIAISVKNNRKIWFSPHYRAESNTYYELQTFTRQNLQIILTLNLLYVFPTPSPHHIFQDQNV